MTFQIPLLWCDTAHSLVTIPGIWLLFHAQTHYQGFNFTKCLYDFNAYFLHVYQSLICEMDDTKNKIQIMYDLAHHTQINHMGS